MEELDAEDMLLIATAHFRRLPPELLERMIGFTRAIQHEVCAPRPPPPHPHTRDTHPRAHDSSHGALPPLRPPPPDLALEP